MFQLVKKGPGKRVPASPGTSRRSEAKLSLLNPTHIKSNRPVRLVLIRQIKAKVFINVKVHMYVIPHDPVGRSLRAREGSPMAAHSQESQR